MQSPSGSTCRRRKCFTMRKIKVKPMENPKKDESRTCEFLEDEHLTLDDHGHVLTAVLSNDVTRLQKIINEATSEEKAALVSRHYTFTDLSISHVTHRQGLHLRLLMAVAVALGYWQIVEVLLKEGVDVLQQDCFGNNVIHSLIMQAFYHPQLEETLVDNFHRFIKILRPEQVKTLLMSENMYKVRAVEFAAQHGACRMVLAIMNVPGVHLHKVQSFGTVTYKWYDVTEYENLSRYSKCPLLFLTFVDKRVSGTSGYNFLCSNPLFQKWFDFRFRMNIPIVVLVGCMRLLYVVLFFVADMDTSFYDKESDYNTTYCRPQFSIILTRGMQYTIYVFLFIYSCAVVLWFIVEKFWWFGIHDWTWRKCFPKHQYFFSLSNLFIAMLIIPYVTLDLCQVTSPTFFDVARVLCPILAVWNIFYFVQLVPFLGDFVITVQDMLGDLLNFSIIFIIMMIPFMHSFQVIVNTNTKIGCFGEYDTLFQTFYSLFRVMLNMVDLTAYNIKNLDILLVAHVIYSFTVSIMMINFFIARLSHSVGRITRGRRITALTRRAEVAYSLGYGNWYFLKRLERWMMRKYFFCERDRVFLVISESILEAQQT